MPPFARRLAWMLSWFVIAIAFAGCRPSADPSVTTQPALIALGHRIFEDRTLSRDGLVGCASCHARARAFTDARPRSIGVGGRPGTRNAPSLLDIGTMSSFFWDGRETRLETVVLQPFTNPVEMGLRDDSDLLRRLGRDPAYSTLARQAFGRASLDTRDVAAALAAYLHSLPVPATRFDRHPAAAPNGAGLDDAATRGLGLFRGKAGCAECHRLEGSPAPLTDNRFHHAGVGFERVAGNIGAMIEKLDRVRAQGAPIGTVLLSNEDIAELGRFAVTRRPGDLGAFRTPSLRDVASTAPYMHDGSVPTLQAAVEREIYYRNLARGRPVSLTVEEQQQLMAFLQALSTSP